MSAAAHTRSTPARPGHSGPSVAVVAPAHRSKHQGERDPAAGLVETTIGETLTRIARLCHAALLTADDPALVEQIRSIRGLAVEGLEDLKSARDTATRERVRVRNLLASLRSLTRRFQSQTRILTELRVPTREPALAEEVACVLYTVADEALEGLGRRSRATGVVMVLYEGESEISLSIRDDGVGLLARQGTGWRSSPHVTIRAMTRAVESVGGSVSVASARPRGLLVRAVVPLRSAAM